MVAKKGEMTTPVSLTSRSKSYQNEIMKFNGPQDFVDFSRKDVTFGRSKSDENFLNVKSGAKTGVEMRFDLLQDSEAENQDYNILWSYYHDSSDIFKNT